MTTLEYAKFYISHGFSVIPISPGSKRPAVDWKEYQARQATEAELNEWFGFDGAMNIGIVTGRISGLAVVDLDTKDAVNYAKDHGYNKLVPVVKTSKGYHLYFGYREGAKNFQKRDDMPGIDLRGEGGFVVAPPSIHESGFQYSWLEGYKLDDLPLVTLPDEFLVNSYAEKKPIAALYGEVQEGTRNDSLARLAGSWVSDGLALSECLDMAHIANSRWNPPLPEADVKKTVESIWRRHQSNYPDSNDEEWPDPIPLLSAYSLPPFPTNVLPKGGRDMVTAVAEIIQVDEALPAIIYIGALSTCCAKRGSVVIVNHEEPVNLYLCVVLESGERKSPTVKKMMAPIYRFQKKCMEECNRLREDHRSRKELRDFKRREMKKLYSSSKDESERAALLKKIHAIEQESAADPEPTESIFLRDDVTHEALGQIMETFEKRLVLLKGFKFTIFSSNSHVSPLMAGSMNGNKRR